MSSARPGLLKRETKCTLENQMQAAFYVKQGAAREVLQVGEQPTPEPGPGEVRVHLKTSGVNPSDWKSRSGRTAPMSAPLIMPHSDGAGDIDRAGPGANRVGERVWIWNGQWRRPHGTAAEYIVLPSAQAVLLPEHIGYAEGACFGIPALTALQAVRLAELSPVSTVMIVGGAGSVAHYAIQFAKMRGARVITTVSGPEKATHARKAGADEVINYRTENVGQRVKALTNGGVDAVIELDLSANGKDYPNILRPHATVVVYGMSSNESTLPTLWLMRNSITLRLFLVYDLSTADRDACLAEFGALLQSNRLIHTVGQRLPLHEIALAHELSERGEVIGNIVLDIG
jgi:NADPH:quinone reductase